MTRVLHSRAIVVAIAVLLLFAAVLGYPVVRDNDAPRLHADPEGFAQVASGERIYRAHCASRHGADLEGQPNWRVRLPDGRLPAPHDETGHTWHHPNEMLFRITKEGLASMVPGYQSDMRRYQEVLTDGEIWAVLAFIKSRWPHKVQQFHADLARRERAQEN